MGRVRSTWAARLLAGAGLLKAGAALWFLVVMDGDFVAAKASLGAARDHLAGIGSEPAARLELKRIWDETSADHIAAGEALFRAGRYYRAREEFMLADSFIDRAKLGWARCALVCGWDASSADSELAWLYFGRLRTAVGALWLARSVAALGYFALANDAYREAIALDDESPDTVAATHAAEARLKRGPSDLEPVPDGCHRWRGGDVFDEIAGVYLDNVKAGARYRAWRRLRSMR